MQIVGGVVKPAKNILFNLNGHEIPAPYVVSFVEEVTGLPMPVERSNQ